MPATERHPIFLTPPDGSTQTSEELASHPLRLVDRPEVALRQIRELVTDDYPEAQRLAAAAAARFPSDSDLQSAHRVLNSPIGPAGVAPPEPAADDAIAWLRNPPDSARGKWVALAGREMLAAADKLPELIQILRSQRPHKRVLVHRIE